MPPESTFTLGAGAIGLIVGGGMGWGMVRAKLQEIERLQKALFKKLDTMASEQKSMSTAIARHDERIRILQENMRSYIQREITAPIDVRE